METMDDYKDELEASFRRINEGDIISGTVIDVNEEEVTLDLKYYAQGIIKVADLSNDPDFNVLEQVHKGDVIEATDDKNGRNRGAENRTGGGLRAALHHCRCPELTCGNSGWWEHSCSHGAGDLSDWTSDRVAFWDLFLRRGQRHRLHHAGCCQHDEQ